MKSFNQILSPEWINYALIDDLVNTLLPLVNLVEHEVESIDDLVLEVVASSKQSDILKRIRICRKKVLLILRLANCKPDVLKKIIKRSGSRNETALYLSDVKDHVFTLIQNLSHFEKSLVRSHGNYLALISLEITNASNNTNDVVMRLTGLASVLIPLNVITGLWGMNVNVPGQNEEGLFWFWSIILVMLFISILTILIVRRMVGFK